MFLFRRFAQSMAFCLCVVSVIILQVFIPIYRGFERRWEFSRYINLSCLKLWFFTIDLLPDLILVLWRTYFKSIPLPKEQCLQQYSCYSCLDMETSLQRWWLQRHVQSWWSYKSYTVLCQLWWSSYWQDMLLMTIASDDIASDDVSSGALLQTRYFRRSSSDAFFRCFKLQINFLCSLTCSIRIFVDITLIIDPVHLNKCLAYPIDNF